MLVVKSVSISWESRDHFLKTILPLHRFEASQGESTQHISVQHSAEILTNLISDK